jgi:sodium-dependent dicarboxylate transporter 2/3/5
MAMGMTESGLAGWLGEVLLPLGAVPPIVMVLMVVGFVIVVTEFASNIAAASGIMPVVAALAPSMDADPLLIALPAAIAASWGFMLPAGTGPNAIAWATGHLALKRMIAAGIWLDLLGAMLIVAVIWTIHALIGYG